MKSINWSQERISWNWWCSRHVCSRERQDWNKLCCFIMAYTRALSFSQNSSLNCDSNLYLIFLPSQTVKMGVDYIWDKVCAVFSAGPLIILCTLLTFIFIYCICKCVVKFRILLYLPGHLYISSCITDNCGWVIAIYLVHVLCGNNFFCSTFVFWSKEVFWTWCIFSGLLGNSLGMKHQETIWMLQIVACSRKT
jgi:hypothetical protein